MKILVFSRLIFYSHSCYPIVIFKLMKVWLILFKGFLIMNRYNVIVDLCYLMADNSDLIFPCDILIIIIYHSFLSKIYAKIIIEKLFKRHMACMVTTNVGCDMRYEKVFKTSNSARKLGLFMLLGYLTLV